tara:strand:- start:2534 stop:2962 length:429 start_codon:yes stop_codon:yes gene_type:complete
MGINSTEVSYAFGQLGSIFTNTSTQVVAPTDQVIVAIQFLSDTTFDELSPLKEGLSSQGICVGDAADEKGHGAEITLPADRLDADGNVLKLHAGASGGQIINADGDSNLTIFPKGLTIYGRWESFKIDTDNDGGVIAYLGNK